MPPLVLRRSCKSGKAHKEVAVNLLTAFRVMSNKGPVNLPTSQMAYSNAYRFVEPFLTEDEINKLGTARSHALDVGEGRGEWDAACKSIYERLFE